MSVNNEQVDMAFSYIDSTSMTVPLLKEKKISGRDYIYYGDNNKYPEYLWNLYLESSVLQGIVNGTSDFISGNGIKSNIHLDKINADGEKIEDLIRKISIDYGVFGGFAFQVLRNVQGEIAELYWLDMRTVRLNKDGDKVFYSNNFNQYGEKAIEYEIFNPNKKQASSVVYFKGHISRGLYPIPRYIGALNSIESSIQIGRFHLNNIYNNLSPSVIVNFNNGKPTSEEKREIEKKLNGKFAGANNAGRILITYNDSKETAVTIERLSDDNYDKKYSLLADHVREEIFIANRAYPILFGMQDKSKGFSRTEFLEVFDLYNKTVVAPIQNDITRVFDYVFGIDNSIEFIRFSLDDESSRIIDDGDNK